MRHKYKKREEKASNIFASAAYGSGTIARLWIYIVGVRQLLNIMDDGWQLDGWR